MFCDLGKNMMLKGGGKNMSLTANIHPWFNYSLIHSDYLVIHPLQAKSNLFIPIFYVFIASFTNSLIH